MGDGRQAGSAMAGDLDKKAVFWHLLSSQGFFSSIVDINRSSVQIIQN
jgi:hypothetical protein